jgi:hypothetical protein
MPAIPELLNEHVALEAECLDRLYLLAAEKVDLPASKNQTADILRYPRPPCRTGRLHFSRAGRSCSQCTTPTKRIKLLKCVGYVHLMRRNFGFSRNFREIINLGDASGFSG